MKKRRRKEPAVIWPRPDTKICFSWDEDSLDGFYKVFISGFNTNLFSIKIIFFNVVIWPWHITATSRDTIIMKHQHMITYFIMYYIVMWYIPILLYLTFCDMWHCPRDSVICNIATYFYDVQYSEVRSLCKCDLVWSVVLHEGCYFVICDIYDIGYCIMCDFIWYIMCNIVGGVII